jgi:hypothetical protein
LGVPGARKDATRKVKVMKNVVGRHLEEHGETMAGIVREAYLEVLWVVRESMFSAARCKGLPRGSRGKFGAFLCDFCFFLGVTWGYILAEH